MDCVFCKILSKDIPNYTVYEDDFVLAFLDIFPHAKGHTVVIPKTHKNNFLELTGEEAQKLVIGVQNTMKKIQQVLSPEGFNVGWNEKEIAGQVVPHLHIHIFPRYVGDGGGSVHSIVKKLINPNVSEVANLFNKK